MGPSGTGKSSLAITYAHSAAARGERAALFTFDENLDLYLAKATAFSIDLRPFIREGVVRAQQIDPAEISPGQFAQLLLNFVEQGDLIEDASKVAEHMFLFAVGRTADRGGVY
jgi:circadian clock protein KaiC